ncbi:hypothetical protein J6590_105308 [Homalodisca vitripennis]|nr:hypothetical protein J6590_105308 [Homalodisca vitripennis]
MVANKVENRHGQGQVEIPSVLQTAMVPVVSRSACEYMYGYTMDNRKICAGAVDGVDSCMGDSGGPLMGEFTVDGPLTKYFLIGVVSYGPKLCGTRRPGVYVKVPSYLGWILDNVKP